MELGILVAAVFLLLAIRWFNRACRYMTSGISTLTREAERFEKEE